MALSMFEQISKNRRNTFILIAVMSVLFLAVGFFVGIIFFDNWIGGLIMAGIFAVVSTTEPHPGHARLDVHVGRQMGYGPEFDLGRLSGGASLYATHNGLRLLVPTNRVPRVVLACPPRHR